MMGKTDLHDLLTPENMRTVKGLELLAKATIYGLLPGKNRSRRTGPGHEFSQYRSYQPGDDLRLLDWKMYARSDRLFVREAEVETQTTVQFIIDSSASMRHEENGVQKIDYARYLVATLAWIARQQGDTVGLFAFNENKITQLPPSRKKGQFKQLLYQLTTLKADSKFPEEITPGKRDKAAHKITFFITDMYEGSGEISKAIKAVKNPRNEVYLLPIFGQKELNLDYGNNATLEDLESGKRVQIAAGKDRILYKKRLDFHLQKIKKDMLEMGVYTHIATLNEPPGKLLQTLLRYA